MKIRAPGSKQTGLPRDDCIAFVLIRCMTTCYDFDTLTAQRTKVIKQRIKRKIIKAITTGMRDHGAPAWEAREVAEAVWWRFAAVCGGGGGGGGGGGRSASGRRRNTAAAGAVGAPRAPPPLSNPPFNFLSFSLPLSLK